MTGDKLADALRAARTWLEADKWRYSTNEKHASWEALMRGIDKAAHSAQGVGDGWVLVQREPTLEMCQAMMRADDETDGDGPQEVRMADLCKAMLAAAPTKETP